MPQGDSKRVAVSWSKEEEDFLIEQLKEKRTNGMQTQSGWKPQTWDPIVKAMMDWREPENGPVKDVQAIKTKVNTLKSDWKIFHAMAAPPVKSGWHYDEVQGTISCSENVWLAYIEAHPKAKPFRKRAFPQYPKLTDIFLGTTADGRAAFRAGVEPADDNNNGALPGQQEDDATSTGHQEDESEPDTQEPDDDSSSHALKRRRSARDRNSSPTERKRHRRSTTETVEGLSLAIGGLAAAFKDENPNAASDARTARVIGMLEDEEGLESDGELALAVKVVVCDSNNVSAYLGFGRAGARRAWLRLLMDSELDKLA